ncbi:C40 family peptidase [Nonomuraea sp. LPB2021202275-12-8]|uniref:C40 family peptidase n=1 Tax=Nonomuraea sp. LPB2021202275-12-8 TaxID=3120159 RepID=UPI00300D3DF9
MHVRAGFLAACLFVVLCPPVYAEPGPSPRDVARARQAVRERAKELGTAAAGLATAQARLDELAAVAERLVEAYNGELVRLRQAEQAHRQAVARSTAADAEVERARQSVAVLAAQVYGGMGLDREIIGMLSDRGGADGYLHRASVLQQIGGERAYLLGRLRDAQEVATILRTGADRARAAQQAAADRAANARTAAEAAVAGQRRDTRVLRAERDSLRRRVAAARSRADLLARRREAVLARVGLGVSASGSAMGDVAANWALTQLGKPYLWAADGPSSYDCSGLTMRAWERAGVRVDHWTGTQWTSGPHVPLDQLRRGDLLFFGHDKNDPATIHHVGIYVGQDLMVHAPQTGDVVRVASMWRGDLVGATRPR